LCTIWRICNRCTGFVAMTAYSLNAKCQRVLVLTLCLVVIFVNLFSERELTFTFAICYRPSVCRLSVTFVRPTQAVQIFGNISTALVTLAIRDCAHPGKARLTSVAIRIRIRIRIRICDPDRHQNLIICSLSHCQHSRKISRKSVRTFLCKVANRQTDRQTTTIT